jgi:hypothetical protein
MLDILKRPVDLADHPLWTQSYIVPTPAIAAMYARVRRCLRQRFRRSCSEANGLARLRLRRYKCHFRNGSTFISSDGNVFILVIVVHGHSCCLFDRAGPPGRARSALPPI